MAATSATWFSAASRRLTSPTFARRWAIDFELLGTGRPEISHDEYFAKLHMTIESGYRHGGFPYATVELIPDRPAIDQIEVRVREGRRFRCGDVCVTGTPQAVPDDVLDSRTHGGLGNRRRPAGRRVTGSI